MSSTTATDIWMLEHEGDRAPSPFLATPFYEQTPMFSPDGRFLAYSSTESGRTEVYVQPYPGPGGVFPISTEGGQEPVWSADGRELFYRNGNRMMAVAVSTEPDFTAGKPRILFEGPYETVTGGNYDVSPDGRRFVMIQSEEESTPKQIHVVLNFSEELKRLAPAN